MRRRSWIPALLLMAAPPGLLGQTPSMAQDSTLDNLQHSPGTETMALGDLGRVRTFGEGRRAMLLIPGLGFGDEVWTEFMERHRAEYRMYAITLPGFGGTAPLAMPAPGTSFAQAPWTQSAIRAIELLLDDENIQRVTIVAHWALASQIALQLALDHPERVEAVVLVGGVLKSYYDAAPAMMAWTPAQRIAYADQMGQRWFKTVTRRTWDDNNFMSYDYAVNPRRGLYLWREAQAPALPVWIRYLLEFYSVDLTARLGELRVPTLVVQPGFDDPAYYVETGRNYMRSLCLDSWRGAAELNNRLEFITVPQSRLFIMFDKPEELDRTIAGFLQRHRR